MRLKEIICVIALFFPYQVFTQENSSGLTGLPDEQLDSIAAYIEAFPENTQLSLALVSDSSMSFPGFLKSDDSWNFVENEDSVFGIGSVTMVFTSALLSRLVCEGALELDDPISETLPFRLKKTRPSPDAITYKMLSGHTSGLPYLPGNLYPFMREHPEDPYRNYNNDMLHEYLARQIQLQSDPGKSYRYSVLGYGLLGYLLEIKTRHAYEDLLLENVFSRYGMNSSTSLRKNVSSRLVEGCGADGEPVAGWDFNALKGAGAVLTSARDLSRFVLANFSGDTVLAFQRSVTYHIGNTMDMALGWHIINTEAGNKWYFQNGGTGGYRSVLVMDVEYKIAVVILSNVSAFNPAANNIDQMAFALLRSLYSYYENR